MKKGLWIIMIMSANVFAAVYSSEVQDGIIPAYQEINQKVTQLTTQSANKITSIYNTQIKVIAQETDKKHTSLVKLNHLDQYDYKTNGYRDFEINREKDLKDEAVDVQTIIVEGRGL